MKHSSSHPNLTCVTQKTCVSAEVRLSVSSVSGKRTAMKGATSKLSKVSSGWPRRALRRNCGRL